ncbi:MAG TPA: hypothetical protein VGH51_19105 [Candidatus Angelobacter sp.]|jgi:hypothetical protein
MLRRFSMLLAVSLLLQAALAQTSTSTSDKKGRFVDKNTYNNPALEMTLTLPGTWEFLGEQTKKEMGIEDKKQPVSDCTGSLCRSDIDISLITKADPVATASIFLLAYKLEPQYLDRKLYPLRMFARSMLTGSVGGSGWTPVGDMTPLQIDGRPAYRLLVQQPSSKGCGYVAESNGYVFMVIGVAPRIIPGKFGQIQEALEKMKLGAQTNPSPSAALCR